MSSFFTHKKWDAALSFCSGWAVNVRLVIPKHVYTQTPRLVYL